MVKLKEQTLILNVYFHYKTQTYLKTSYPNHICHIVSFLGLASSAIVKLPKTSNKSAKRLCLKKILRTEERTNRVTWSLLEVVHCRSVLI